MVQNNSTGDRLRTFALSKCPSIKDFSELIGMEAGNVQKYLNNKRKPGTPLLKRLQKEGCDINWLLTGEGKMYANEKSGKSLDNSKAVQKPENDRLNAVIQRLEHVEKQLKSEETAQTVQIPLYIHAVSAGTPCTVSEEVDQYLSVQKSLIRHPKSTYAVRASGDSMINAGIEDGDILIADHQAPVKDRCIVIASINGEQTVKRIIIQAGAVTLAPENEKYPAIPLKETDNVKILGIILGIYRQLY